MFDQAMLLAGQLEPTQMELLRLLCQGAVSALRARLRQGITPESCREAFVAAASLYARAALGDGLDVTEFRAGDLTVKRGAGGQGSFRSLEAQADRIMAPYVQDRFAFLEV